MQLDNKMPRGTQPQRANRPELRHVLVQRRVLLVERDAPLQESDAGAEVVADQRFEPAFECLECRGLFEIFERRPDRE
jgi:hypothetical protein